MQTHAGAAMNYIFTYFGVDSSSCLPFRARQTDRPSRRCNGPWLHYSVDLRIQTYTEPVPLKYGKLDPTKYMWIYG